MILLYISFELNRSIYHKLNLALNSLLFKHRNKLAHYLVSELALLYKMQMYVCMYVCMYSLYTCMYMNARVYVLCMYMYVNVCYSGVASFSWARVQGSRMGPSLSGPVRPVPLRSYYQDYQN